MSCSSMWFETTFADLKTRPHVAEFHGAEDNMVGLVGADIVGQQTDVWDTVRYTASRWWA